MSKQEEINLGNTGNLKSVEEYKFEPIKGYPMLNWMGKRPFQSTQYYPAQLKESYGEEINGWMNKIYWGDNLQVMSHLLKEYRGKIDLVYIDPPFDSKADYKKKIELRGEKIENTRTAFEEKQYSDIWSNDDYLQFMYDRLILLRELLSNKGSIYVHMDEKRAHYIKIILDEVFGNFQREIIWDITVLSGFKTQAENWIRGHDSIYFYTKSQEKIFNKLTQPHRKEYLDRFNKKDEKGRLYFDGRGEILYLDDVIKKGKTIGDVWNDIMSFQQIPTSKEKLNYPTQKPEALLERIIRASSNPGDIVFDCFMGSGTTQAVAMRLGRKFIGSDINLGAIQTVTKRLLNLSSVLNSTIQETNIFTGVDVYNVNHYDVFRNPVEAKDILIKALEIQPLPGNSIYDGEKDGKMVKIMPIERITTRADLSDILTNLPWKIFEKRNNKQPGKPVENILIVCMGHEPDLQAYFSEYMKARGFYIDVEVVDVLRDKLTLEFKRDSEAVIKINNNNLIIKEFFPMNLLQKLSIEKNNISDWRELVESIMIDFNFDGAVMSPTIIDIPEKNKLVKGEYKIPSKSGTIKIKITDLLSESLEVTING